MSETDTTEKKEQTEPIEALTDAVDEHHDKGDHCGAPVGRVVDEMLTVPGIDVGDVGQALREGYFHGVIYQPSQRTVARVATDGGTETTTRSNEADIPLLHDDFEKCDECGEIVLMHGSGECLELDDAVYCPRHARGRMDDAEWDLRWGEAMRLLRAIREDPTKAVKYELISGVGNFYAAHREGQHYELWRRCEDDQQRNFTTISESSLVENIERRCAGSAYLYDPPHLVEIDDAPINAQVLQR